MKKVHRHRKRGLSLFLTMAVILGLWIPGIPRVGANEYSTIYVATDGNDTTGTGSSSRPYRTIGKAAAEATPGTTVLVRGGVYLESNIRPNSGNAEAMIVFKPASPTEEVIIRHPETFSNPGITPEVRANWIADLRRIDSSWNTSDDALRHYTDSDIRYSIEGYVNDNLTDVFNLTQRSYVQIEGFTFSDYKYARSTINILNGNNNIVINNRFINIGTVHAARWNWTGNGPNRGDVTINISGNNNVVRNNYMQSVIGEQMSFNGSTADNIISENTIIGAIGKNGNHGGSDSSTLGGRFGGNLHNVWAFNYNGGTVNGYTIWLDVDVKDFLAVRNEAHNTAGFIFNESGCKRNWIYENIAYNKPLGANGRMPADPDNFTDFRAQTMPAAYFTAFWETGSTFDARWVNNVAYNVESGIVLERSWRDEVRNNIVYEDSNSMHNANNTVGLKNFETAVIGYHSWHGDLLRGGGPQIFRNNLWFSARKPTFVRNMASTNGIESQPIISAADFGRQIGSATELGVDPMFVNPAEYDFRLRPGSPAIGSGDNGVNRGAYALYPKTEVGYNKDYPLTADVNAMFGSLNSTYVKPGEILELEVRLSRPATKRMTYEIVPVAGDARLNSDVRFVNGQTVTFNAGETTKTVRVEIVDNAFDLDQLLVLKLQPTGSTELSEVGGRNMHIMRIKRVNTYSVTLNDVGDSIGRSVIIGSFAPGETVTIDAKTRPGRTFVQWNWPHNETLRFANRESAQTTFTMPARNVTLYAEWNEVGLGTRVTGITINRSTLALNETNRTATLTGTVQPANATNDRVFYVSTNPLVASVDHWSGLVTARGNGTAEIIAKSVDGGTNNRHREARCIVTVTGIIPEPDPVAPSVMRTDGYYTIRNANSNRYLEVAGDNVAANSNVVQGSTEHGYSLNAMWRLEEADNGYYFIRSAANETLVIDIEEASADNGANISLWTYKRTDNANQQFKFAHVGGDSYTIRTRLTNDSACVEVEAASTSAGGNVIQWVINGLSHQNWIMEFHEFGSSEFLTIDISDESGRNVIEVRNPTNSAISCTGLYISNSDDDRLKWKMPSFIIKAGESILIRGEEDDVTVVLKRAQVNFNATTAQRLYLSDFNGNLIDDWGADSAR